MRVVGYASAALAAIIVAGAAHAEQPGAPSATTAPLVPTITIINAPAESPATTPAASPAPEDATTPAAPPPVGPTPSPAGAQTADTAPPAGQTAAPPGTTPSVTTPPAPAAEATPPAASAPVDGTAGSAAAGTTPPPVQTEAKAEPPPPPPEPTLTVDIDLGAQRMTVSEQGATTHTWPISSARSGYRTPTGTFRPVWMTKIWYSRQYDWSPMPHAIFFHGGTAIHGTYATGMLGRPASHGCVRLARGNAATLYRLVGKHGKAMTRIVVHGTPPALPVARSRQDKGPSYADVRRGYRYAPGYYGYDDFDAPYYYAPRPMRRYYARPPRGYGSRGYYGRYGYGYGF